MLPAPLLWKHKGKCVSAAVGMAGWMFPADQSQENPALVGGCALLWPLDDENCGGDFVLQTHLFFHQLYF